MKLNELLEKITPLPWLEVFATDNDKWTGTKRGDDRIATLDGNTHALDHTYLVHAANVLPELVAAAENLQEKWEHNLTEPMAWLNEALELAEEVTTEPAPGDEKVHSASLPRNRNKPFAGSLNAGICPCLTTTSARRSIVANAMRSTHCCWPSTHQKLRRHYLRHISSTMMRVMIPCISESRRLWRNDRHGPLCWRTHSLRPLGPVHLVQGRPPLRDRLPVFLGWL
jgi:hypothetical protein